MSNGMDRWQANHNEALQDAPEAGSQAAYEREITKLRNALEDIALLDEADGHELTATHAHRAVARATKALGKHPSEILAERNKR